MKNVTTTKILEIVNGVFKCMEEESEESKSPIFLKEDQINCDISDFVDSLTFVHIIVALEEYYEMEIPDEYLILSEMNSISKITKTLKELFISK